MKKKLSRLNIDELKQMYDVLDTELLRSFLGGADLLDGSCVFSAMAYATGKSEGEIRMTYIDLLKKVYPGSTQSDESWNTYIGYYGVSWDHMPWLANQFKLSSDNTGKNSGVLVLKFTDDSGNVSGHAVTLNGVGNGYYHIYDAQKGVFDSISLNSTNIFSIFWKN